MWSQTATKTIYIFNVKEDVARIEFNTVLLCDTATEDIDVHLFCCYIDLRLFYCYIDLHLFILMLH